MISISLGCQTPWWLAKRKKFRIRAPQQQWIDKRLNIGSLVRVERPLDEQARDDCACM
ncbi:hypothetical protein WN51_13437 [Melipona quadrifasciata]|uniref:Uncharacterized protein n=1 Tax=Melipona quadrifasciata TaxID=166423 RepID=A0A0M9A249_9HYME|nr:hypothetical protein WN51_13437 [Melipona quadrifasciata]